ncbi:MAG: hypothetical protein IMZ50_06580 [Candidatus Atribacteria bacterium]|nr:hypothetical protein [Candidatus Atribacteria bacterium]
MGIQSDSFKADVWFGVGIGASISLGKVELGIMWKGPGFSGSLEAHTPDHECGETPPGVTVEVRFEVSESSVLSAGLVIASGATGTGMASSVVAKATLDPDGAIFKVQLCSEGTNETTAGLGPFEWQWKGGLGYFENGGWNNGFGWKPEADGGSCVTILKGQWKRP